MMILKIVFTFFYLFSIIKNNNNKEVKNLKKIF